MADAVTIRKHFNTFAWQTDSSSPWSAGKP